MRHLRLLLATAFVVILAACAQQAAPTIEPEASALPEPRITASAVPADLFFSEYVEGSSNNKALELFNGTGAPVDLAAGSYRIETFANGSTVVNGSPTVALTGIVLDGETFVIAPTNATQAILDVADQVFGAGWFNGNDAVVLTRDGVVLDVIGQVGTDPGSTWGSSPTATANQTLRRQPSVCVGDPDGSDAFDPAAEWTGFARNTFDGLGAHVATCDDEPTVADPRLNEFSANTTGIDVEFLEVFGSPTTDYAAYTVLAIEGDATSALGSIGAVVAVGTTDAAGLWLANLAANELENGTITLLLVEGFTGAEDDDLDADDDGVLDVTPWTRIVDAVAVNDGGATDLTYVGAFGVALGVAFDGAAFAPGGASRVPDGTGDWVRNDFDLAGIPGIPGTPALGEALNTPGAPNAIVEISPCALPVTPIHEVQGSGLATPLAGQTVLVRGVVVGDYEGSSPALSGFYLQAPLADADADRATSEGLFVFNRNADLVNLGDDVVVSGTANEYQDQTQVAAAAVTICGSGASVTPTDVTLPVTSADDLERYEGMLVRFPQTLYVTELFQLGRFGQVTMSVGDRLAQPTAVAVPGAPAAAVQAANDLARIIVDDAFNDQNPDTIVFGRGGLPLDVANPLRGGDTATGMVGVLSYTWAGNGASGNAYRLRPIGALGGSAPDFQATNPRPADPPAVGGALRVASLNVLNYFTTLDTGPAICGPLGNLGCRGADSALELERQRAKILATLEGLDADVIGLIELENDGGASLQDLADGLNDRVGANAYAAVATGPIGSDAITVGFLYRSAAVAPLGGFAVLDDDFDPDYRDGLNRPALAQTFVDYAGTGVFTVVVNHLKSKGSDCNAIGDADLGDGQGNCNATRTQAVQVLLDWLATDPTGAGDPDVLVIGDLNAYAMEDPIRTLEAAGYANLQPLFGGLPAITYVFDGQWGALDYALASPSLVGQVAGAGAWHTNAAEPSVLDYNVNFKSPSQIASLYADDAYRASDHDPLLVGLHLDAPNCSAAAPSRATLWPPRHKYVSISIDGVTDGNRAPVPTTVTSVFQDEPVDAPGDADGSTAPDAAIGSGHVVDLRAERDETGNGRVYHVNFRATDAQGQACAGSVTVAVPSSQGRNGAAVDDGPLFDATID